MKKGAAMPTAFNKKPKLVRFVYDELPLNQRDLEELLLIIQLLSIDRLRILQIVFPSYDDPEEIRIAAHKEGYYLGLSYPMDDYGCEPPLLLAAENLPIEEVNEVIQGICAEGKSTGDIPVVMEKLKDVTAMVYGKD